MEDKGTKYSQLEVARILGEPKDPRKPYSDLVTAVAETATASPEEYVYYFDVLLETDKVVTITGTGELSSEGISPDSPTLFTFVDVASPEYYVKITDLAGSKESTLTRKLRTLNRALNAYENNYIIRLAQAAAITASHQQGLEGTDTTFNYKSVIDMVQDVVDYGDNYVLIVGSQIDTDMKLWDWTDNKYSSMIEAFKDLGIEKMRVSGNVTVDGSVSSMLASTKAYLVARNSEVGNPFLFVRKKLNDIDLLGGAIKENGDRPERLVFVSPNPIAVTVGSAKRYLAVGLTGYEEIVAACINPYAVSEFTRANIAAD